MRGITMADEKMINRAEQVLYKTYNRFPVVFDHGKGVTLWDSEGQEYQELRLWVWDTQMRNTPRR